MKWSRCSCWLVVKLYPNTPCILGIYHADHDHPIGGGNAHFTHLSEDTREHIAEMLHMGFSHEKIVSYCTFFFFDLEADTYLELSEVQGNIYEGPKSTEIGSVVRHDKFITSRDIWWIEVGKLLFFKWDAFLKITSERHQGWDHQTAPEWQSINSGMGREIVKCWISP